MASENESTPSPTEELNLSLKDDLDGGSGGALEDDYAIDICHICENKLTSPKLLSCLHVFCEECLNKLANLEESVKDGNLLNCPSCKQKTQLTAQGVSSLQSDLILEDILQKDSEEIKQIGCTSCKAEDKAVARCKTCENLLCPNCVTAHQFMRCFEDHQVVTFEEMIKSGEGIEHLRKPVFCTLHPLESVKFFCSKCLVPACGECVSKVHAPHESDIAQLTDAVCKNKENLLKLGEQCGNKLESCQKMNSSLNLAFEDLEMQKDSTKGLIEETFQSYKAILEEARDACLKELDDLHEKREIGLMESMYTLSNYESKLSQAKVFIERTCSNGHAGQVAQLLHMMFVQLDMLFKGFDMPQVPPNTEFKTDNACFKSAVDITFGSFSKEKQLEVSLPMMGASAFPGGNMDSSVMQSPNSLEMSNLGLSDMQVNLGVSHNLPTNPGLPINILSGLRTLNLAPNQTGHVSGNNSPLSDSGISVDNISHGSGGNATNMFNAATVAKMQPNQSPLLGMGSGMGASGGNLPTNMSSEGKSAILPRDHTRTTSVQNANIEELASLLNPSPLNAGVFNNFGQFDPFATQQVDQGVSSPDSLGGEPYPPLSRSKMNPMQIRCKFGSLGPSKGQFNSPHGFCLGVDEDIVVADTNNHRMQVFQKTGEFKYQFGIPGREESQLWYPRKVAVVRQTGKIIICDRGNERSRMQIFNRNGHFLRRIAIRFIDIVAGLDITPEGHIVAVDSVSPTVFRLTEAGDLIKWFDCSDYMREPSDIVIDKGDYYICDFKGHCVVAYGSDGHFLRRIGCENITNYPNGIDISGDGDVLVGDSHGNRFHVGVFQKDGSLVGEFQCPYVKVSRCCGLRLTTEGYIVTLAKNNHHVLVLNTLYIP